MRPYIVVAFLVFLMMSCTQAQILKSVVYDFDGLDINQTDLPEGDYSLNDLNYAAVANPLPANDMIGDRVLKLNLNWNTGNGTFGKGISRFIEFDPNLDVFNFYFYNPAYNNQDAVVDVIITDDDNQDNVYQITSDDNWQKSLILPASGGWQLISIPLKDFTDTNPGGDGVFNIAFTGNKGMLLMTEFYFKRSSAETGSAAFYLDMVNFSERNLPTGNTVLDLPHKNANDYCLLGAFQQETRGQEYLIPQQFESLFPAGQGKKIKYANYFLDWAIDGTTVAKELPGNEVQQLLNNGYTPVITWEPLFQGYVRLDPVQPRLYNIINGDYNLYIDQFAQKIKTFNDTVIIRFMHEFEGDWYPWSISQNNQDPNLYKTAFQAVVNRFRSNGVSKVKWMWCLNSDYAPYAFYNWAVTAYPGDAYVDIVASDIYNNHFPSNSPFWKSFRQQATESYYYLNRYFPQKPIYICEVGCRERFSWENTGSQSKGDWYERMNKEMQSNFHKVRALIFFNAYPDQNWTVNSSPYALQSLTNNVWNDSYYFDVVTGIEKETHAYGDGLYVYPNPSTGRVTISYTSEKLKSGFILRIHNAIGETVYSEEIPKTMNSFSKEIDGTAFQKGIYLVELSAKLADISEKKIIYEIRKLVMN
ncbi:MAG: glycosyl hydrolase [Bacteroidia bacterium]